MNYSFNSSCIIPRHARSATRIIESPCLKVPIPSSISPVTSAAAAKSPDMLADNKVDGYDDESFPHFAG